MPHRLTNEFYTPGAETAMKLAHIYAKRGRNCRKIIIIQVMYFHVCRHNAQVYVHAWS